MPSGLSIRPPGPRSYGFHELDAQGDAILTARLTAALLLSVLPLGATAADLPDARTLIDRYMETVGGEKAIEAGAMGTAKMTMEIIENGLRAPVRMYLRPNAMRFTMSIAGTQVEMGMSQGISWMIDPTYGPRLLEDEELQNQVETMSPGRERYDLGLIESMKTTALSDSEGRACYRVDIVWKSGSKSMSCFGTEDGLVLSTESTVIDPSGESLQLMHMYDYKILGGVLQPSRMRMKTGGMNIMLTIDSFDGAMPPDDVFALPPAIVALLKHSGTSGADAPGEASPPGKTEKSKAP